MSVVVTAPPRLWRLSHPLRAPFCRTWQYDAKETTYLPAYAKASHWDYVKTSAGFLKKATRARFPYTPKATDSPAIKVVVFNSSSKVMASL